MFPEPTEMLLIGYSIELFLASKIQIKYVDTKNQLADILTKRNFTRDEWNHLLCLFNISHFSSSSWFWCDVEKNAKDSGEERVTEKSKPVMNLVSPCSERDAKRACLDCIRKPGEKQEWKTNTSWARVLSSSQERWDLWWALAHQTTQNGTLTKSGLLKSGNLVNVGSKNVWDPWVDNISPAQRQVCHRWRWCGLWHRHRIEPFR